MLSMILMVYGRIKKETVDAAFINFYNNLFSCTSQKQAVLETLVNKGNRITEEHSRILQADFTKEDVKRVMFTIPNDKAPGIDGFNSCFYKHCWEVIGDEVSETVLDFF